MLKILLHCKLLRESGRLPPGKWHSRRQIGCEMSKSLYIAEKPSVAREFAKALKEPMKNRDGFMESEQSVVTWCVGHLVTMSYPEAYDAKYKKWSLKELPFLPEKFKYEVIPSSKKQYDIVARLLTRKDVDVIYVCTDSGREGEYIYRLVEQMAGVQGKERRRVWIDSQTEEEILRGIREAKDLSEYDNLSASAYLRAKEDYLMGINFSRLLTLKYGNSIASFLNQRYSVVSVGRVMTCVLGMVVRREREIRDFVKTPFYRVVNTMQANGALLEGEWKAVRGSVYFESPKLYKENGFRKREDAEALISMLQDPFPEKNTAAGTAAEAQGEETGPEEDSVKNDAAAASAAEAQGKEAGFAGETASGENTEADGEQGQPGAVIRALTKKSEKKYAPLLYNLAELQNDCSRMFRISPDETLRVVQELYEKKLVTYPRTDARVLSTAAAKEIAKNIKGLEQIPSVCRYAQEILAGNVWKNISQTRYVNDKMITDHYAIIPTGQGIGAVRSLHPLSVKVYEVIVRRFLAIFYPPAVYRKVSITASMKTESFFASARVLEVPGYLRVMNYSFGKKKGSTSGEGSVSREGADREAQTPGEEKEPLPDAAVLEKIMALNAGDVLPVTALTLKEGETSPPKRYNSGSLILAMENAGQLIEDEELRAQIRGSGIGTSATRAEILKKLVNNRYLSLNKKTQIITPTLLGEMIYDVVDASIRSLLNPELTASWEKGLTYVAEGSITPDEYMEKLESFIKRKTAGVMGLNNQGTLGSAFRRDAGYYRKPAGGSGKKKKT